MGHPLLLAMLAASSPDAAISAPAQTEGVTAYPVAFFASAQPNSAMDMIVRIPGFSFDGGSSVRGYGGAAGNVLIDGQRPASKSESLEDALRRIQASQVERIELVRGGAPGIDMQGKTVIANVILRKGAGDATLFAVATNIVQDGRTSPAMRFEGARRRGERVFDWSVLAFNFIDDGAGEGPHTVRDATGAPLMTGHADETGGGHGLTLKGGVKTPFAGGALALNTTLQNEHFEWSLNDRLAPPLAGLLFVNDNQDRDEGEIGGSWERPLGPRTKLELTGLTRAKHVEYVSVFDDQTDTGAFSSDTTSGESVARAVLRYTVSPTWSLEGGGEAAFNYLDSATDYVENGVPVVLPAANVRVEERRGEVFATSTWRASGKLSIEAGLRVEVSTISQSGDTDLEKSFTYPKPRLSATWSPTPIDQVRLRLERELGQLDFGDFVSSTAFSTGVVTAGNADLEPDKAWVAEAAYERKFWQDGAVVLTVTHKAISDATDRIPIIGPGYAFDAPGNIGDGTSDSLALSVNLPLARLGVPGGLLRATGTWSRSEVTDPTTGEQRRISGQHPFDGEVHFSQSVERFHLQWGVDAFINGDEVYYRFDQIETVEVGPWLTTFVEYKPRPNLSLRVEAANLLGREFTRDRVVYAGPRDISGPQFSDRRPLTFDPFLYVRIRRTFG